MAAGISNGCQSDNPAASNNTNPAAASKRLREKPSATGLDLLLSGSVTYGRQAINISGVSRETAGATSNASQINSASASRATFSSKAITSATVP